jgi:hypothetical protein
MLAVAVVVVVETVESAGGEGSSQGILLVAY